MSPQRNLGLALGITLAATTGILIANWHLDPFALGSAETKTAIRTQAQRPLKEAFWQKTFAVKSVAPAALILGTSRADTGLDGAHAGFVEDARPVYNLALAGASIDQIRELLVHAQRSRPLRQAVIGLDLEAFLSGGRTDFDPALLAGNSESGPEWLNRMRLHLSWRALAASAELLRPAHGAGASPQGPSGQRHMFRWTEFKNINSQLALLFPPWSPGTRWDSAPRRAASMRAFRDLLAFARAEGIDLRLFISPVHARYLELYRGVEWWPMFEAWKRSLVAALADEARARPRSAAFPLWDFSGFNKVTMEAVPPASDSKASMRWYYESSHYSLQHGNLILDRVLGRAADRRDAGAEAPGEVGVLIDTRNIEIHLRRTWHDAEAYRAAFPADVAEVREIVRFVRRAARK